MFASLARYRALRIGTFPFAYRGLIPTRGTRNHHFASAPFPCFSAAELNLRFREDSADSFWKPCQTIDTGDKNILEAPVLKLSQH